MSSASSSRASSSAVARSWPGVDVGVGRGVLVDEFVEDRVGSAGSDAVAEDHPDCDRDVDLVCSAHGCVVTDVSKVGTLRGVNVELYRAVTSATTAPVTAVRRPVHPACGASAASASGS